MKFVNMENGQILSKGRFETAKIEAMERDTDNKKAMDSKVHSFFCYPNI